MLGLLKFNWPVLFEKKIKKYLRNKIKIKDKFKKKMNSFIFGVLMLLVAVSDVKSFLVEYSPGEINCFEEVAPPGANVSVHYNVTEIPGQSVKLTVCSIFFFLQYFFLFNIFFQ